MQQRSSSGRDLREAPSPDESITVICLNSNMTFSRVPKTDKELKEEKGEAVLVERHYFYH